MHWSQCLNGLQFNHKFIIEQKVNTKSFVEQNTIENELDRYLTLNNDPPSGQTIR